MPQKFLNCFPGCHGKTGTWRLGLLWTAALLMSDAAFALSNNKAIVANSITALPAEACSGHAKIDTCVKMLGSVDIVAGVGTPAPYSVDELAFLQISTKVDGIAPSTFPSNGVSSIGANPITNDYMACYVLDANPGQAGTLTYSCEVSTLACNALYSYQFAGSRTTTGAVAYSSSGTPPTIASAYTLPCGPSAAATVVPGGDTGQADITIFVAKGALPQTIGFEYGTTTAYGMTATPTAGGSVPAADSGQVSTTVQLSGLSCNTTYYYRFTSTTDDGAINGQSTSNGDMQSFTTGACPMDGACGTASGGTFTSAPSTNLCSAGDAQVRAEIGRAHV